MEIRPLTGVIGAEILGVDLAAGFDDETRDAIRRALLDHLVVFFRDQCLDGRSLRDAAARFGTLEPFAFAPTVDEEVPEVHELTFDDGAAARGRQVDSWHIDGTFMARPPMATMLYAAELPALGGDTCWANLYEAYDALSPRLQHLLGQLEGEHDYAKVRFTTYDGAADETAIWARLREQHPPRRHPVVRTHPETGRRSLFVSRNYQTRLVGLTERENDVLLPFLFDHVRDPRFQCRFRWTPGAVALWDNRCTQHLAVADYRGRRAMHRVVLTGDEPR